MKILESYQYTLASKVTPVPPVGTTNFSNHLNSNFQNGWGQSGKKPKPKKKGDDKGAKEPGKGENLDVKATSERMVKTAGVRKDSSTPCSSCCRFTK